MLNFRFLYMGLLCSLFSLGACKSDRGFRSVNPDMFQSFINDTTVQRLDVRTLQEYDAGHIPGAVCVDVLDPSFTDICNKTLSLQRPVALYCRGGNRSKKAAEILSKNGFEVVELDKGFLSWLEAGKEVEVTPNQ